MNNVTFSRYDDAADLKTDEQIAAYLDMALDAGHPIRDGGEAISWV